jgi:ribose transport system permease protein
MLRNQSVVLAEILLIIFLIVSILEPRFISAINLQNILHQSAVLGIVSLGMNLLMISGGLDLSIGSTIGLTTCVITTLVSRGSPIAIALLAGCATAAVCGFLNGIIISKSKGFPFVITLGTMSVFYGIALVITEGRSHSLEGQFQMIGQKGIGIFPYSAMIWILIAILLYIILKYLKFGRTLYMLGGNEKAALLSGVNVNKTKVLVYTLNGIIIAIASLVFVSRLGSAVPLTGGGYELRAIAVVVIGGASLFGGKGSILGCILGAILLSIISNALNTLHVSYFYQGIVLGAIIIVSAVISTSGEKSD